MDHSFIWTYRARRGRRGWCSAEVGGQGGRGGLPQRAERQRADTLDVEHGTALVGLGAGVVGGADAQERDAAGGAQVLEVDLLAARDGDDGACPALGEQGGGEVDAVALAQRGEVDTGADVEAQARVDERLEQVTGRQV